MLIALVNGAASAYLTTTKRPFVLGWIAASVPDIRRLDAASAPVSSQWVVRRASRKTQVDTILAKPNYRHQKKQKEQARKLRQAEKQNRRMAARTDAQNGAATEAVPAASETTATSQAET
jgi:hypothetical protein